VKDDGSPAHRPQLRQRVVAIARLADRDPVAGCHLVAADNERVRVSGGDRTRLGLREPNRRHGRELFGVHHLVDFRRDDAEGQTETLQERPAVARRGRQNQRGRTAGPRRSHCFHASL
jgi:hypothetical protein